MFYIIQLKTIVLFFALCLVNIASGQAQDKSIPYLEVNSKIDGILDDQAWEQAETFADFNNFYPNDEGKAQNKTEVRAFHNGNHLYIGVRYYDTTPESKISTLKRDNHGDAVVASDAFGMIIDPFNTENSGYYFTLNTGNAQLDALVEFNGTDYDFNESWNTVWESETSMEGNVKLFEIKIPLKAFNFNTDNSTWGFQFFYRDFKTNEWMTYTDMSRNYFQFDLRFTEDVRMEKLPRKNTSKFTLLPAITASYQKDKVSDQSESAFIPSLDAQYNITSSLRLEATINPDFSQVDVDQQVVNLTRFAINFPERRNFFLENSDLFNNLGTFGVNPFYSRIIGGSSDMSFGVKLSGNVTPTTRIGILNAQTRKDDNGPAQNYAVLVGNQRLNDNFTTTAYMVGRQETDGFDFLEDYNRVLGLNLNFKSDDKLWSGQANYGKSLGDNIDGKNNFFNVEGQYNTRETFVKGSFKTVEENFLTDIGFTPRLYNFDDINGQVIRDSYLDSYVVFQKTHYPGKESILDRYRYLSIVNDAFWGGDGKLTEMSTVLGNSIWFKKNLASLYANLTHSYFDLMYGFDILGNGNPIQPGVYNTFDVKVGYDNRSSNQNFIYGGEVVYGGYFNGTRSSIETALGYRVLPYAQFSLNYSINHLDLEELGASTFHLAQLTSEVYFSNRLSWTTFVQYNTQRDNLNVNSRLQWEYKPLSYVYVVLTDNLTQELTRTNWGAAIKVNRRLDL